MSTTALVIIIVVAVLLVILAAGLVARRAGQRRQLRERFGPEYDRTVGTVGDSKEAEADLRARAEQRDQLSIRALSGVQRDRYEQDWRQIQSEFVDYPARSLARADSLLTDVMVDQGYPMQDFDRQADLISVDHPEVVEHYRMAHGIHDASQTGQASTEDIRQAFVSYRLLFAELLGDGGAVSENETARDPAPAAFPRAPQTHRL